jgi:hypothetical protein
VPCLEITSVKNSYFLLTPWSRVLPEELNGFQLIKKFPAFYGTRIFIAAFTSARQLSLSSASSIQSIPPHPTSWKSILSLFRCWGLTRVSVQVRESCKYFVTGYVFTVRSFYHLAQKLGDHPLSAVRDCLFNIFATTIRIGGHFSIRNLRTRPTVVTVTHLSRVS